MKFIKIGNDYIDLKKVVAIKFDDEKKEIHFSVPGFGKYVFVSSFDSVDSYIDSKRYLISILIKLSIDCEVVEC